MGLALIWAQSVTGVIGKDGAIPWHLPEDMRRFRETTAGGAVIMGRRTWESLPERFRPLPGRTNIVVTRQDDYDAPGAEVAGSLDAALALVPDGVQPWIIGGGQLYLEAIDRADRIELTEVLTSVEGDTFAPLVADGWHAVPEPENGWLESSTGIKYRYLHFTR
ncbi:dihydrofolate reductase [Gryllotalpicola sp.]|uniref:dihydrofolate reductase n=1 Tax=Gryllotalpicola sp. TaxID=1932787 RepID=UPI002635C3FE|nr:dihydrofolate reductase [Gryllotalpicola sp.]